MPWRCPKCGVLNEDSVYRCARSVCTGEKVESRGARYETERDSARQRQAKKEGKGATGYFLIRFIFGFGIALTVGLIVYLSMHEVSHTSWSGFIVVFSISSVVGLMAGMFGDEFLDALSWILGWL